MFVAHPQYLREKARTMRVDRRFTLDQIAVRLALPRTTIYYWIRDLPVPNEVAHSDRRQAARRRGNRAMQRKYGLLREEAYREGQESGPCRRTACGDMDASLDGKTAHVLDPVPRGPEPR
jgi:hypothetical protein